jgi:hypothetical protein
LSEETTSEKLAHGIYLDYSKPEFTMEGCCITSLMPEGMDLVAHLRPGQLIHVLVTGNLNLAPGAVLQALPDGGLAIYAPAAPLEPGQPGPSTNPRQEAS